MFVFFCAPFTDNLSWSFPQYFHPEWFLFKIIRFTKLYYLHSRPLHEVIGEKFAGDGFQITSSTPFFLLCFLGRISITIGVKEQRTCSCNFYVGNKCCLNLYLLQNIKTTLWVRSPIYYEKLFKSNKIIINFLLALLILSRNSTKLFTFIIRKLSHWSNSA